MKKWISIVAIFYFAVLLAIAAAILVHDGAHWPITLFLFSPRWVVVAPLAILIPLTLVFRARFALVYLAHCGIILFPIMGFRIGWNPTANTSLPTLKVMTANMGAGSNQLDRLVATVRAEGIHVLMFQECPESLSRPVFEKLGWQYRQRGNLCIGSVFELGEASIIARHGASHYYAIAAVECLVSVPGPASPLPKVDGTGPEQTSVHLVSVHLPTFRPAFEKAQRFDSETAIAFGDMDGKYRELANTIHKQLKSQTSKLHSVVAGDFNVPVESDYYRDYWHAYRNAFSEAGMGFGYTKHTRYHGVRIDHVLIDSNDWQMESATVGPNLGGDHNPVIASFSMGG